MDEQTSGTDPPQQDEVALDVEVGFTVWLSTNYDAAQRYFDAGLSWDLLVEMLRRAFTAGVGHGMLRVVERMDQLELERKYDDGS